MRKTRTCKRVSVNSIFLVGEVVDMKIRMLKSGRMIVVSTIKMRAGKRASRFVYVDIYGKAYAETMTMICQTGNIVYVEGEFRNKSATDNPDRTYISVTHIECLLRRKEVKAPTTNIVELLDSLDPLGYKK